MNLGQIKAEIKAMVNRADTDLDTRLNFFVNAAMRGIERGPNYNYMITETTALSIVDATASVTAPTDYKEAIYWFIVDSSGNKVFLKRADVGEWDTQNYDYTPDEKQPTMFTFRAGSFLLNPTADATYTNKLVYYAYSAEMTSDGDTNRLTDYHPELLVYRALMDVELYLGNADRVETWAVMYQKVLSEVNSADNGERSSGVGNSLQIRRV